MEKTNVSRYDTLRWLLAGLRAEAAQLAEGAEAISQADMQLALDLFNTSNLLAWSIGSRGQKGAQFDKGELGVASGELSLYASEMFGAPPEGGYEGYGFPCGVEINAAEDVREHAALLAEGGKLGATDMALA